MSNLNKSIQSIANVLNFATSSTIFSDNKWWATRSKTGKSLCLASGSKRKNSPDFYFDKAEKF